MADINDTTPKDAFDFSALVAEIDAQVAPKPPDAADAISDKDKPVKATKTRPRKTQVQVVPSISNQIKREFDLSTVDTPVKDKVLSGTDYLKKIALSNISADITMSKAVTRAWAPKVKAMLPASLYGKVNKLIPEHELGDATKAAIDASTTNHQIVNALIAQQKLSVDQYIRNKSDEMVRSKIHQRHHIETSTILTHILSMTKRTNAFFEGTFRKYLMTSIELKFKHIFVSKDILNYTKLMLTTLSTKLDTVKHNTSLPDTAKRHLFDEFKRTLKVRANTLIADAILGPLKKPVAAMLKKVTERAKVGIVKGYNRVAGRTPVETTEDTSIPTGNTLQDKVRLYVDKAVSKIKGVTGTTSHEYGRANMTVVHPDHHENAKGHIEGIVHNVLARGEAGAGTIVNALDKGATAVVPFDVITRRSIIDIIPGFLSKIHSEASSIAKMIGFAVKGKLDKKKHGAFDKSTKSGELVFDRNTEDFVTKEVFAKNTIEKLFGDRSSRTKKITPIIEQLHVGFKQHGGDDKEFGDAIPSIVQFVNNISKHAKVVKLDHIKKYLDGAKLTEQEQDYLDAVLVDVPKRSRKRLIRVLGTTFFKDKTRSQVDAHVSKSVGEAIQTHVDMKKHDADKLNKLATFGDHRHIPELYDTTTGEVNHAAIRKIQSDVDTGAIKAGIKKPTPHRPSAKHPVTDIKATIRNKLKPIIDKVSEALPEIDKLKGFKIGTFPRPISRSAANAVTAATGIPNRDTTQISGPGVYIQGAEHELHIPLVNKVKKHVNEKIGKLKHIAHEAIAKAQPHITKAKHKPTDRIHHATDAVSHATHTAVGHVTKAHTAVKDLHAHHIPTAKSHIDELTSKAVKTAHHIRDTTKRVIDHHQKPKRAVPLHPHHVEHHPTAHPSHVTSTHKPEHKKDLVVDTLTRIRSLLSEQFHLIHTANAEKIHLSKQMLEHFSMLGSPVHAFAGGEPGHHDETRHSMGKRAMDVIRGAGRIGRKGVGLYKDGLIKFYKGLGTVAKKTVMGALPIVPPVARGAWSATKAAASAGKKIIGGVLGAEASLIKKIGGGALNITKDIIKAAKREKYIDVYRKDEVKIGSPLMKGASIRDGRYVYSDWKVVKDSYSIKKPVFDSKTEQLVITDEDIKHGLVDSNNHLLSESAIGLGASLIIKGAKAYGRLLKGTFRLIGKGLDKIGGKGGEGESMSDFFSRIPGLKGLLARRRDKQGLEVNTKALSNLVTKHLVRIISLLKPITHHFDRSFKLHDKHHAADNLVEDLAPAKGAVPAKGKKEPGSIREATKKVGSKVKERTKKTVKKLLDHPKAKAAMGAGGVVGAGLGYLKKKLGGEKQPGPQPEKKEEDKTVTGSALGDTAAGTVAGGAALKLAKTGGNILKKGAGYVARKIIGLGAKGAATAALGGLAAGGTATTAAAGTAANTALTVAGSGGLLATAGTAVVAAVGWPVILGGLALAGLGAATYGVYHHLKGRERRMAITKLRNAAYKVPGENIDVLMNFEDDMYKAVSSSSDPKEMKSKTIGYMKQFGFDSKDKAQYKFFSEWFAKVFFPVFKVSCDIFPAYYKVKFSDQEKLTDEQIDDYKHKLDGLNVFIQAKNMSVGLTLAGCKAWEDAGGTKTDDYGNPITKPGEVAKAAAVTAAVALGGKPGEGDKTTPASGAPGAPPTPVDEATKKKMEAEREKAFSSRTGDFNTQSVDKTTGKYITPPAAGSSPKKPYIPTTGTPGGLPMTTGTSGKTGGSPGATPAESASAGAIAAIGGTPSGTGVKKLEELQPNLPAMTYTHNQPAEEPGKKGKKAVNPNRDWSVNESKIMSQLVNKHGWSLAQAAGIAANIKKESSGDPTIQGDKNKAGEYTAYGIAQWHPDRQRDFAKWAKKDIRGSTLEEQVAFMNYELREGKEKGAGKKLLATNDPVKAGAIVSEFYERPGAKEHEKDERGSSAGQIAKHGSVAPTAPKEEVAKGGAPGGETPSPTEGAAKPPEATKPEVASAGGAAPAVASSGAPPTESPITPPSAPTGVPSAGPTETPKAPTVAAVVAPKVAPTPAVANIDRNAIKATPAVAAAPPVPVAAPPAGKNEIVVTDPEGKRQTALLTQQNSLLSQIVGLLGNKPGGDDKTKNGALGSSEDSKQIIGRLDMMIASIKSAGGVGGKSDNPDTGTNDSRSISRNQGNYGIDVSRVATAAA